MAHIYNDHEQPVTIMVDINDTSNSTGFSEDSKCGSVSRVPKAQDLFRGMCTTVEFLEILLLVSVGNQLDHMDKLCAVSTLHIANCSEYGQIHSVYLVYGHLLMPISCISSVGPQ